MTEEWITHLKKEEGCKLTPYFDFAGYPTIGFGHLLKSIDHPPITMEEAERLLREDAAKAEAGALQLCPNLSKYPRRLAALADLVYNVGKGALDGEDPLSPLDDSGTVKAFRREDWKDAAERYLKWDKAGRPLVVSNVLHHRRAAVQAWILEG